jgi:hypothetical protein
MVTRPFGDAELDALAQRIEGWLRRQLAENPVVAAVERDETQPDRRWFLRVHGEEKDVFSIWFRLGQRTLSYETYLLPDPETHRAELFGYLLRHNRSLYGATFAVGDEDAVFLVGQLDNRMVDDDELDRVLGSLYGWVERYFRPALRLGFANRFKS